MITKKLFLTFAEKRRITEIAVFGGYGGKKAVVGGDINFFLFISKNFMISLLKTIKKINNP